MWNNIKNLVSTFFKKEEIVETQLNEEIVLEKAVEPQLSKGIEQPIVEQPIETPKPTSANKYPPIEVNVRKCTYRSNPKYRN